ncbi:MAG: Glutamate--tRNA ligase mitochondrial [Chrysothrix sp. TS-e1954]|nr:MAG: Glutamate--tRNA ligase mitochondrial [Chrysothrix sp. TS-e1954]
MLSTPHGYRCFCSADRLDDLARRRAALGLPPDYDRTCAGLSNAESDERASAGEPNVIRLRSPESYPSFTDMVYGQVGRASLGNNAGITHKHGEVTYEDPVLLKSDGMPTYHFANVIDDHEMDISHVVRGTEWISSTPKHLALYDAFGWKPPQFAHVGLLVDGQGRKLSKRNMDTSVRSYREAGFLPEALVNFAALLGWSHSQKSDVMDLTELVDKFRPKFTRGNTTVTFGKLDFLQKSHAQRAIARRDSTFYEMVTALAGFVQQNVPKANYERIIQSCASAAGKTDCAVALIKNKPFVSNDPKHALTDHDQCCLIIYCDKLLTCDAKNYTNVREFVERNSRFFGPPATPSYMTVLHRNIAEQGNETIQQADETPAEGGQRRDSLRLSLHDLHTAIGSLLSPAFLGAHPDSADYYNAALKYLARVVDQKHPSLWQWTRAKRFTCNDAASATLQRREAESENSLSWNAHFFADRIPDDTLYWPNPSAQDAHDTFSLPLDLTDSSSLDIELTTPAQRKIYSQLCRFVRDFTIDGANGPGSGQIMHLFGRRNLVERWASWGFYMFADEERLGSTEHSSDGRIKEGSI